jgi:branched-chain amino acid transport system ATP-binding protein
LALLEVRNLTMKFGSLVANSDVSFEIEPGTIVGLIGPNGAGKTTLFNCISGLYRPASGRIVFDQKDITLSPAYKVARLGAVRTFQVVHPLKDMTVLDNVLVGAFLRNRNPDKAYETAVQCIDACRLTVYQDKPAGELTIGTKKRLEMARALATGPKLLMLDEAMAGLTTTEIKSSVELIQSVREKGVTLLVVEHIMEAIMPIADKMVVLDGGIKIAEGSPREIINDESVIRAYLGEKFAKRMRERSGGF